MASTVSASPIATTSTTIESMEASDPETENNNHLSVIKMAAKNILQQNIYLENNLPLVPRLQNTADDSPTHPKPLKVSQKLETDETSSEMMCVLFNSDHGHVIILPDSLASTLSSQGVTISNSNDSSCPGLPMFAKLIYFYQDSREEPERPFLRLVVHPLQSDRLSICLEEQVLYCLLCKTKFTDADSLVTHAASKHDISCEDFPDSASAIIQSIGQQAAGLHRVSVEERVSPDTIQTTPRPPLFSSGLLSPRMGCEEHPDGGIECPKCDLTLSSARSLGGHMTMMHSRNSCKTLKCPKCNWHYKYQETLEIHMKEKHPDTEQTCIYCVTKQSHPKLARGESYMCGYKPYRCEVCNYSTTTKGNLSIHMQSDKHINNMQEIQSNGGSLSSPTAVESVASSSPTTPAALTSPPASIGAVALAGLNRQKPGSSKNTWRCDVCNYETNIARNLRIHMTSEKHTHNMLILQQNVKSMQRNMHLTMGNMAMAPGGQPDAAALQQLGTMFPFDPMGIVGQMEAVSQQQGMDCDLSKVGEEALTIQNKRSRDTYGCVICNTFTTDDLNQLDQHLSIDRSATTSAEHVTITPENHYLCNLCQYKTSLKANFQLHCKTDKHVQRVQLVNHIREGGSENEWRMRYLNIPNPVHIVCNVCTYQSNNIHKMRIHALSPSHITGASLFVHLRRMDEISTKYHYTCGVCHERTFTKIAMVSHVRKAHASMMEQMCAEKWVQFTVRVGSPEPLTIAEEDTDKQEKECSGEEVKCPHCSFTTVSEVILGTHITSKHGEATLPCPLCSDRLPQKDLLEQHLFSTHNVNKAGAERLIAIIDTANWKPKEEPEDAYRCQTCIKTFKDFDTLSQHQSEQGHLEMRSTPRGPGYLCWKKGCNQYFKTAQALQVHFREIHAKSTDHSTSTNQDSSEESNQMKCFVCSVGFASSTALRHHLELSHIDSMNESQLEQYRRFMTTNLLPPQTSTDIEKNKTGLETPLTKNINEKSELSSEHNPTSTSGQSLLPVNGFLLNSPIIKTETTKRDHKPYKCNVCNISYGQSSQLDEHLQSSHHQQVSAEVTKKHNKQSEENVLSSLPSLVVPPSVSGKESEHVGDSMILERETASPQHRCIYCQSVLESEEKLTQHKLCCPALARRQRPPRSRQRRLLHNIGIECVMGFLESEQQMNATDSMSDCEVEEEKGAFDLPEMSKVRCSDCGQKFSGLWVLKSHKEEVHHQIMPESVTERIGSLYKADHDEKEAKLELLKAEEVKVEQSSPHEPVTVKQEVTMKAPQQPVTAPQTPLDMLGYPGGAASLSPWLTLFPFGLMPTAFNPMVPTSSVSNAVSHSPMMTSPPPQMMSQSTNLPSSQAGSEKRARTRITDDQLKVLRQYFDINNSPSEEAIMEMAAKTGLPAKVIKHWFRNTLFKERQRNKDSPYNFNNPPQTTLNLEEYEKTGRVPGDAKPESNDSRPLTALSNSFSDLPEIKHVNQGETTAIPSAAPTTPRADSVIVSQPKSETSEGDLHQHVDSDNDSTLMSPTSPHTSVSSDSANNNIFSKMFGSSGYKFHEYSNSGGSKRANRTRFTDYQIKTLQEYFEQNAYPKDEEIEQLSRVLHLPNRVIVVWFQNARQKARKVYENNPTAAETTVSPSIKSSYPCKKCGVTFSGYYDLIKHQKRVCMKNNHVTLPFGNQDGNRKLSVSEDGKSPVDKDETSKSKAAPGQYECKNCLQQFQTFSGWNSHQNQHVEGAKLAHIQRFREDTQEDSLTRARRARTVLSQKQQCLLYTSFLSNSCPSHIEMEQLRSLTSLTTRVIQVWFQNARAKERRGELKAPALFPLHSSHKENIPNGNRSNASTPNINHSNQNSRDIDGPTSLTENTDSSYQKDTLMKTVSSQSTTQLANSGISGLSTVAPTPSDIAKMMYGGGLNPLLFMPGMLPGLQPSFPDVFEQAAQKNNEDVKSVRQNSNDRKRSHTISSLESPLDLTKAFATSKVIDSDSHQNHLSEELISVDDTEKELSGERSRRSSGGGRGQKRYRTNLTSLQIHVMKNLFKDYKTPTMAECEVLGGYIGLQKRVVQVWFQNARAKEKKVAQTGGTQLPSTEEAPRAECNLCSVKYSHKCTLQDHIFSIQHINRVNSSFQGKLTEVDRRARSWCEENQSSMGSMGNHTSLFKPSPKKLDLSSSLPESLISSSPSSSLSVGQRKDNMMKHPAKSTMSESHPLAQGMMGMPGADMLSMMYSMQMPFLPGFMPSPLIDPSAALASLYQGPVEFGTPLSLLQIPQAAIRAISRKLCDRNCSSASYTEDCMTVEGLSSEISKENMMVLRSTSIDLGYACRGCQLVYPRREACASHQSTSCFIGRPCGRDTMLKIEQQMFRCTACSESLSTAQEFKLHCSLEAHKNMLANNNSEPLSKRLKTDMGHGQSSNA